jgi:hypothetical protein
MSSSEISKSKIPQTTRNSLADIVGWLKSGDMVILCAKGILRQVYHINDLPYNRKIYVNLSTSPSLMEEGEWPYYIKSANATLQKNESAKCPNGIFSFVLPSETHQDMHN